MTTPIKPRPVDITLNKGEKTLQIKWNINDEVSIYPLPQLREACPCVQCRGGHAKMGAEHDPKDLLTIPLIPARSYGVKKLNIVGNYALQPTWDDNHATGMYTWEYLYKLRPNNPES
jgi:DUF971 family protein